MTDDPKLVTADWKIIGVSGIVVYFARVKTVRR